MAFIPNIELLTRHKVRLIVYALVFWLIIGSLVAIAEVVSHFALHTPYLNSFDQKQYLLRWVLWLMLTPVIILLGLKINIRSYRVIPFVVLHILLSTIVLAIDFNIEVLLLRSPAEVFYQRKVYVSEFLQPFLLKYFAYVIIYFLIVGIVNMYVYMATLQNTQQTLHEAELQNNELKYQLTVSRLRALRMQVHPHFLFNTHNAVIGLILRKENDKAAEMLTRLSNMLRLTLEEQTNEFVTLNEELQIADLYLGIQKVRFPGRFTYTRQVSTEAGSFRLPYLLLQPLIENAVIHGVERTDEEAYISVAATLQNDMLHVEITNNFSHHEGGASHKGRGIGMANVAERLQQYYGDAARFEFIPNDNGTTIARLKIPTHEQ